MKKMMAVLCLIYCTVFLCGCEQITDQINTETILQQVETIAQQLDAEAVITDVIQNIDWRQLEQDAKDGYHVLTEHFPALKSENIKAYLKSNGLELLNSYVESSDAGMRENARKLSEILKILNPELTDEVNAVIDN